MEEQQAHNTAGVDKVRRTSSSLRVFRAFIVRETDGTLNVDGVISRDCYEAWMRAKGVGENDAQAQKFRRTLTNHVAGTDGRCPLEPDEERAILILLRKRQSWPCFPATLAHIGKRYRSRGYHEAQSRVVKQEPAAASPPATPQPPTMMPQPISPIQQSPPLQQQQQGVQGMLSKLRFDDAIYLAHFGDSILSSASPALMQQAQAHMYEMMRLMITGHTPRDRSSTNKTDAEALCLKYSTDSHTLVTVMDMTAEEYSERVVAQNRMSENRIGHGNDQCQITKDDLFRVLMAIGAAYYAPGVEFTVYRQETRKDCAELQHYDVTYFVDPGTFLLIAIARKSQ